MLKIFSGILFTAFLCWHFIILKMRFYAAFFTIIMHCILFFSLLTSPPETAWVIRSF